MAGTHTKCWDQHLCNIYRCYGSSQCTGTRSHVVWVFYALSLDKGVMLNSSRE